MSGLEIQKKKKQLLQPPFDSLRFAIIPRMNYWMDGNQGERTIFISDECETVQISLEEGMQYIDLTNDEAFRCAEYRKGNRYLHQAIVERAARAGAQTVVFFHVEITDANNRVYGLPGQMITSKKNTDANTVDPILLDLLNSITLVDEEMCEFA